MGKNKNSMQKEANLPAWSSSQHDIFFSIEIIVMGILAGSYVLVVLRANLMLMDILKMWMDRWICFIGLLGNMD